MQNVSQPEYTFDLKLAMVLFTKYFNSLKRWIFTFKTCPAANAFFLTNVFI